MNRQEEKEYVVGVGECLRIYCNECQSEYEVLHEPMYRTPKLQKEFGGRPKPAKFCPFCGTEDHEQLEIRDASEPAETVSEAVQSEDRVHRVGQGDATSEQMKRWTCQPVASTLRELRKMKTSGGKLPELVHVPGDERLRFKGGRYHRYNSSGFRTQVYVI